MLKRPRAARACISTAVTPAVPPPSIARNLFKPPQLYLRFGVTEGAANAIRGSTARARARAKREGHKVSPQLAPLARPSLNAPCQLPANLRGKDPTGTSPLGAFLPPYYIHAPDVAPRRCALAGPRFLAASVLGVVSVFANTPCSSCCVLLRTTFVRRASQACLSEWIAGLRKVKLLARGKVATCRPARA